MNILIKITPMIAAICLSGCSQLPLGGPAHRDIASGALVQFVAARDSIAYDYALVDVTPLVIDSLPQVTAASFQGLGGKIRNLGPSDDVGIGDVLAVTIFESAVGGLFLPEDSGPRPANSITMPNQTVSKTGFISVPYAGKVRVAGRRVAEIEHDIERKLAPRAIEPQVVITQIERNSASVSVIGDTLNAASRFGLTGVNERVLDMIARAGGTKFPGYELFVTLMRHGQQATISFSELVGNPSENVFVQPGDTVYVFRHQQKYIAIGALGSATQTAGLNGQFTFDQDRLSLNEGLARAGGLLDTRADPSMVFLYRLESRATLERIGVDLSCFPLEQTIIPTIYRMNFRDPSGFFAAQRFMMRDKDVIYASNADSIEMRKFFDHARAITSTAAGVATDISIVRNVLSGSTTGTN